MPDSLLCENVPKFPTDVCDSVIRDGSSLALRCPNARGNFSGQVQESDDLDGSQLDDLLTVPFYQAPVICCHTLCDLGVPMKRLRKYMAWHLFPYCIPFGNEEDYKSIFFRELACDASVFLVATEADVALAVKGVLRELIHRE